MVHIRWRMCNKLGLTLSGWKYVRKEAGEADLGFHGGENTCKSSELMKPPKGICINLLNM